MLLLVFGGVTFGQDEGSGCFGEELIQQAEDHYCAGDTMQALRSLETYAEQYPDLATTVFVKWRLAEHLLQSDTAGALRLMNEALAIEPMFGWVNIKDSCVLFQRRLSGSVKADMCVEMNRIYRAMDDPQQALHCLELADTKYLPYQGCGNGMLMYKTFLSPEFAKVYLQLGDTAQAMDRLLLFLFSTDGDARPVAAMLKEILLERYTAEEIARELRKGIRNIVIVDGREDEPEKILRMTVWGHVIREAASRNAGWYRRWFRQEIGYRMLTSN
ncbi:MAG: hypothetical protein H6595_06825 [Flavobacteriales bacterium]|nr:hypothetical protein [Flavobacteriales bacterium]MCB9167179.1 hypothetical protein [Flavobacteriales bacterium]